MCGCFSAIYLLTQNLPLALLLGGLACATAPGGTTNVIQEYKARGRYVWFTEQPFSYAIGSPDVPKTRYIYDPSEIRAFTWSSIMEMAVSDKKRFSAMKAVSEYGMSLGDDPFKWWVTFEEVTLKKCKEVGAKKAIILNVSAPFHCSLMKPAAIKMEELINDTEIIAPKIPIVQNVSAAYETQPDMIRRNLVDQIYSPVRWTDSIKTLFNNQIENYVECGPGRVLSGLIKRANKKAVLGSLNSEIALNQLGNLGK